MKIYKKIIVIVLLVFVAFRLLVVPIMQKNAKKEYSMYFNNTTDSYLVEYDGVLQDVEYYNQIDEIVIGDMGYAYILDESGTILVHPNPDVIGFNISDFNIPEITASIGGLEYPGEEQIIEYEFKGVTKIVRFYKDGNSKIIAFTDTYSTPSWIQLLIN
jgi:hypothetical protein